MNKHPTITQLLIDLAMFGEITDTGGEMANAIEEEVTALTDRIAALEAERDALRAALIMIYEKWEDGDRCYEDPTDCENYMGNAVRLYGEEEDQILALIPKERAAIDAAKGE